MKILFKQLQGQDLEVELPGRSTPGEVGVDELREAIARLNPEVGSRARFWFWARRFCSVG